VNAAVLTISDGVFAGAREDASGDVLEAAAVAAGFAVAIRANVPDDVDRIREAIEGFCDGDADIALVLATGGTGFAPRDVTPEALRGVLPRLTPGIDEAMRAESMRVKPHGMLSRGVSGIRGGTLVLSFPGSPRACAECFAAVQPVLDHALRLLRETPTEHL
jgi:molybdenum cofactor synthesis domain-containing protein